jgi:iron(III) transport system permease protein
LGRQRPCSWWCRCCPSLHVRLALASPGAWAATILDDRQRGLLINTTALGVGSAVFATAIGAPLGFILSRVPLPFKSGLRVTLMAPLLLPPYVIALAWIYLEGTLRETAAGGRGRGLPDPYTLGGAIVALTVVFYPLSMIATEVGLRRVETRLEEAALLVARPGRVLWRITWPLVAPGVISAALVIFVLSISEFSVPGLLRVRVLHDRNLYGVCGAVRLRTGHCARRAAPGRVDCGGRRSRFPCARPRLRHQPGSLRLADCAVRGMDSDGRGVHRRRHRPRAGSSPGRDRPRGLRADSMAAVLQGSSGAVINSLVAATIGATAITAIAICLGYARARTLARRGAAVDVLWIVLFTVPSTVLGIGLIGVWNRPAPWGWFYGTSAMLVIGYVARFLPVAALAVAAAMRSVPTSQEEAAAVSGSRLAPHDGAHRGASDQARLLAVWAIALILSFGEVGTSILVAPAGESTLPIRVYTMTANAAPGQVATLALFQSLVILGPLVVVAIVLSTRNGR